MALGRVQPARVGAFDFANQEFRKAADTLEIVRVGLGLVSEIGL